VSRTFSYAVVDVFTDVPFAGNPLAVFPDASGLTDEEMQMLARELNLSETSFVFPSRREDCAARVRFFTPGFEVPFAGHPTIGTSYVLVDADRVPSSATEFGLEENVGRVRVRVERRADPFLAWLSTPKIRFLERLDREACAAALGLGSGALLEDRPAQILSAGTPFVFIALRTPHDVDRAELDARAIERAAPRSTLNGVFVFAPVREGAYSRMFAPMSGILEDPATGGATGPLGAFLATYGLIEARDGTRFQSEQGVKMRRRSILHGLLHYANGELETVEVGGGAVRVIEATVMLPGE